MLAKNKPYSLGLGLNSDSSNLARLVFFFFYPFKQVNIFSSFKKSKRDAIIIYVYKIFLYPY